MSRLSEVFLFYLCFIQFNIIYANLSFYKNLHFFFICGSVALQIIINQIYLHVDRCLFRVKWLKLHTGANIVFNFLYISSTLLYPGRLFLSVSALLFNRHLRAQFSSSVRFQKRTAHADTAIRLHTDLAHRAVKVQREYS